MGVVISTVVLSHALEKLLCNLSKYDMRCTLESQSSKQHHYVTINSLYCNSRPTTCKKLWEHQENHCRISIWCMWETVHKLNLHIHFICFQDEPICFTYSFTHWLLVSNWHITSLLRKKFASNVSPTLGFAWNPAVWRPADQQLFVWLPLNAKTRSTNGWWLRGVKIIVHGKQNHIDLPTSFRALHSDVTAKIKRCT